jgi:hypothetical protein
MGLFGTKKRDDASDLPPLQFPELPKSVPEFEPSNFGSDMEQVKSAMSMPKPILPDNFGVEEKPLFVKIEKYKDVVETLKKLKARLNDADIVLGKITRLKEEEDRELAMWQGDLEKIRNQLMDIDRNLFE